MAFVFFFGGLSVISTANVHCTDIVWRRVTSQMSRDSPSHQDEYMSGSESSKRSNNVIILTRTTVTHIVVTRSFSYPAGAFKIRLNSLFKKTKSSFKKKKIIIIKNDDYGNYFLT